MIKLYDPSNVFNYSLILRSEFLLVSFHNFKWLPYIPYFLQWQAATCMVSENIFAVSNATSNGCVFFKSERVPE